MRLTGRRIFRTSPFPSGSPERFLWAGTYPSRPHALPTLAGQTVGWVNRRDREIKGNFGFRGTATIACMCHADHRPSPFVRRPVSPARPLVLSRGSTTTLWVDHSSSLARWQNLECRVDWRIVVGWRRSPSDWLEMGAWTGPIPTKQGGLGHLGGRTQTS